MESESLIFTDLEIPRDYDILTEEAKSRHDTGVKKTRPVITLVVELKQVKTVKKSIITIGMSS